jgi:hypothetical protein
MHYRSGRRWMVGAIVGLIAVAAVPSVAQAEQNPNDEAELVTKTTETAANYSATSTITVPTLNCSGVAAGSYAGQTSFLDIYNGQATEAQVEADVRSYCNGTTATYAPVLVTTDSSDTSDNLLTEPSFPVKAGDKVQLTVKTTATSSTATIKDLKSGKHATQTTPDPVANGWTYIGADGISANSSGAPITGDIAINNPYSVAGPESTTSGQSFAKTKFASTTLQSLSNAGKLNSFAWETSDGSTVLGQPSSVVGNVFSISYSQAGGPIARTSFAAAPRPSDG